MSPTIEPLTGRPELLTLGRWECNGEPLEVAGRRCLDTRQAVPSFVHDGVLYVGVLRRERASRLLRGPSAAGLEPLELDFDVVEQAGHLLHHGRALFTVRADVELDKGALVLPLPGLARSIGYLTELALPLLVGIEPPPSRVLEVPGDGGHQQVEFLPLESLLRTLEAPGAEPHSEDLLILLRALRPGGGASLRLEGEEDRWGRELLEHHAGRIVSCAQLAGRVQHPVAEGTFRRLGEPCGEELRFLSLHRVRHQERWGEVVTPSSGATVAMLPFVRAGGTCYFLLWQQARVAVLERHARQPLYDTPLHPWHVSATACFIRAREAERLTGDSRMAELEALVPVLLRRAIGAPVIVRRVLPLGPAAEPAPALSAELRHRVACELAPAVLEALPPEALLISAPELSQAIAEGWVRDPVIISALQQLGPALGVEPFAGLRQGRVEDRLRFLNAMTEGSRLRHRLKGFPSIEREQLQAPTYARLMTLLQNEYGVRLAWPCGEADRSFFNVAWRLFMADGREEDRAPRGPHRPHDAFRFALGSYTPPPTEALADWYIHGRPVPPEPPCEGPEFEQYCTALEAAGNEATFFSSWTLYHENLSLARHVGRPTFYEVLRELGITTRAGAREVFDAITRRAELPDTLAAHPLYRERAEVRALFQDMLGSRERRLRDIRETWRHAARDMYRGIAVRFGLSESGLERYLAHVHGFQARLEAQLPGLNPLKAACADTRVELCLRAWEIIQALERVRRAVEERRELSAQAALERRRAFFAVAEELLAKLEECQRELAALRAGVGHAELTPRNESTYHSLTQHLRVRVERVRQGLWDAVAATGLVDERTVAEERTRELPR